MPNVYAQTDGQQLLDRVQAAAQRISFQGTVVHSAAGSVSSVRILRVCEGGQRIERSDSLDGRARQQFRHAGIVQTFWPQSKVATIEREADGLSANERSGSGPQIGRHYAIGVLPPRRVAGHLADGLLLEPRDASRFAKRLWVERDSGLLLRTEWLSADGRVIESSGFSDLAIGARSSVQALQAAMKRIDGYRVLQPRQLPTTMEAEGWQLVEEVAGFRRQSCTRRPLDPSDSGAQSLQVLQAVYSDGLAHVSLFLEPLDPARHRPMRAAVGATHTLMQAHGPAWLTVMGDVPPATLELFAAALERRR